MNGRNRELFAHLALALSRYQKEAVRDGLRPPAEVLSLAEFFADCAQQRQNATPLAPGAVHPEGEGMRDHPLLTRRETAAALRCSSRTVDRLIASGALPAVKVEGSTRIRRVDLDVYVSNLSPRSFRDDVTGKASA